MNKKWLILIPVIIIAGVLLYIQITGCFSIIDKDGIHYEPTVDNLIIALNKGGEVKLPIGDIEINKYVNVTNIDGLKMIGYGPDLTSFSFPDHRTWLGPGGNYGQPSTVTKGLKRFFFDNCTDVTLQGFKVTGAGKIDFHAKNNYVLRDITMEYIDRPYIHHREPGGRAGSITFILPMGRMLCENILFKNIHISHTTVSSICLFGMSPYSKYRNVTYSDCSLRHIGETLNGINHIEVNNWSAGFHFPELLCCEEPKTMYAEDFLFENCIAEYCWEAGFHSEGICKHLGSVDFVNCESNYNGQKDTYYGKKLSYHGSGFFCVKENDHLVNCRAKGNSHHGIEAYASVDIEDCVCENNDYSGVYAYGWQPEGDSTIHIKNTICRNNGEYGFRLRYYYAGGEVERCEATDNNLSGIFFHRMFGVDLIDNDIVGNQIGIEEGDASDNNFIARNYLCNTGQNLIIVGPNTVSEGNVEC